MQLTRNYRPYRAAKFSREDDSCFNVMVCPELCIYPGNLNPRVRWEASEPRQATRADYARTREHAKADVKLVIKDVENAVENSVGRSSSVCLD